MLATRMPRRTARMNESNLRVQARARESAARFALSRARSWTSRNAASDEPRHVRSACENVVSSVSVACACCKCLLQVPVVRVTWRRMYLAAHAPNMHADALAGAPCQGRGLPESPRRHGTGRHVRVSLMRCEASPACRSICGRRFCVDVLGGTTAVHHLNSMRCHRRRNGAMSV